jgi:hypothetical protein
MIRTPEMSQVLNRLDLIDLERQLRLHYATVSLDLKWGEKCDLEQRLTVVECPIIPIHGRHLPTG